MLMLSTIKTFDIITFTYNIKKHIDFFIKFLFYYYARYVVSRDELFIIYDEKLKREG